MTAKLIALIALGLFATLRLASAGEERPGEKTGFPARREIQIPMRDGKELAADFYPPKKEGKYPCILVMTPYNKNIMGAALPGEKSEEGLFDRENYVYVVVDWRGFYGSKNAKGDAKKGPAKQNGEDGFDVVEWIAGQEWSDGKVGMWGPSALGRVQFATAETRPPHLTCIAPVVATHGQYYEDYYYGGVLKYGHVATMNKIGFAGILEFVKNHPTRDALWKIVENGSGDIADVNVPVFLIGGWYDTGTDAVLKAYHGLRERGGDVAKKNLKLLIGPWTHVDAASGRETAGDLKFPDAAKVSEREARRFFDFYLRGKTDNGYDKEPSVRYFQMNGNRWAACENWPPEGVKNRSLWLRDGGKLTDAAPDAETSKSTFTYDPGDPSPTRGGFILTVPWEKNKKAARAGALDQKPDVESRKDHASFTTDVLKEDRVMQGAASVKLFVSSDREDTDFAVRLCDVFPDGRTLLVSDGIQRVRYRGGEKSGPMKSGEVYAITVRLVPTAWTFQKGHAVRVIVTSSNYPRFDANPNNGKDFVDQGDPLTAQNSVHHDKTRASELILPVNPDFK